MREIRRDYLAVVLDDGSKDGRPGGRAVQAVPAGQASCGTRRTAGSVRASTAWSWRSAWPRYLERDIAIVVEADFSNSPDAVPDMVREIEAGADAIGARTHRDSRLDELLGQALRNRIVSTVLKGVMPLPKVSDYTSTFQAFRVGPSSAPRHASGGVDHEP